MEWQSLAHYAQPPQQPVCFPFWPGRLLFQEYLGRGRRRVNGNDALEWHTVEHRRQSKWARGHQRPAGSDYGLCPERVDGRLLPGYQYGYWLNPNRVLLLEALPTW